MADSQVSLFFLPLRLKFIISVKIYFWGDVSFFRILGICGILNPKNPKSDQHLISPHSTNAESLLKIMRIKDTTINLRNLDC